jgi:hypothetical protein
LLLPLDGLRITRFDREMRPIAVPAPTR